MWGAVGLYFCFQTWVVKYIRLLRTCEVVVEECEDEFLDQINVVRHELGRGIPVFTGEEHWHITETRMGDARRLDGHIVGSGGTASGELILLYTEKFIQLIGRSPHLRWRVIRLEEKKRLFHCFVVGINRERSEGNHGPIQIDTCLQAIVELASARCEFGSC